MAGITIPLAVPNLSGKEREYLNQCIDTTFVSSVGEFVTKFEELGASLSGAKYGVATSSGTTGLHLALMTVGVKPGDIVIIPSFTFIATANAVAHCGAIPWVMDIEPETWCIDAAQIEEELEIKTDIIKKDSAVSVIHKETAKRVAAIMPVYTLGCFPDMNRLRSIADRYNLPLVADAACAIGAEFEGQKLGGLADLSVFSFNGNKTVTAGGGGLVIGNDKKLLDIARHISTTARVSSEYDFDMVGYNYRMTNIQAAVGCAQLERLDELVGAKRRIRRYYKKQFAEMCGISLFPSPANQNGSCWFSGVVLDEERESINNISRVREICSKLRNVGIEARSFWKPVHLQKPYEHCIKATKLDVTESLWDRIVVLPCSTGITDDDLLTVLYEVKKNL